MMFVLFKIRFVSSDNHHNSAKISLKCHENFKIVYVVMPNNLQNRGNSDFIKLKNS